MLELSWLLIAIPLAGAALLLVWGKGSDRFGHLIATAASAAAFVLGLIMFIELIGRGADDRSVTTSLGTWFEAGRFHVEFAFTFDQLSSLFVLLITGVGTLIHLYSIGYMAHDERRRRFFAYLNLFVAAMLTLVLAADYLVLFLGWEGVGLASYLLIGFWQHKETAAAAANKAFIMNRVGDLGMVIALMTMFATFGTTSIAAVNGAIDSASGSTATALGLLLLVGACGKSAQVPLQAWLLDAMEGPTPVSALIHAATMVTAGVYLVVRSAGIYDASEIARTVVVIVGLVTLLVGAWIGCAKDDIKKVLAGSTMSQIGYMMLAAGLGPAGYAFAIFHLLTHGFFKANMFLGAGSVMHAMDDDVDMRHYGALRRAMPITFVTFGLGYLAIIGFPGMSGFFSKDKIIEAALGYNVWIGLGAMIGAGVTAFYMTRLMMMTFFGEKRWRDEVHPHESPSVMTIPLVVLAAASVLGGVLYLGGWITDWLEPIAGHAEHPHLPVPVIVVQLGVMALVALGVAAGVWLYRRDIPDRAAADSDVSIVTRAGRHEIYTNEVNGALVVLPMRYLTRFLVWLDVRGIDGTVTGTADRIGEASQQLRRTQTGYVRSYALGIFGGALLVVLGLLAVTLA
ncbi:NADH-quinone oxidoreductase subunit L [Aeromicrobium piscarium]|uniref:NADH-quinone oxidoreductase subunit L n=1 Tax=Aeromicrobium piscarium TaxID=2590901 RepID=A0A554SBD5_9ACTN|nr:NADH-quinone oxidoreductase subunit L [Aeromicrobium piscarium]TSD63660.1 NADH-quinone oxidoreductase subunit L [Aeromicrobium piscarium]